MNYSNTIKTLNPADKPMVDTDYYHWLAVGGFANDRLQCKIGYLRSKGFTRGKDKIDQATIGLLNHISSCYFYQEVA